MVQYLVERRLVESDDVGHFVSMRQVDADAQSECPVASDADGRTRIVEAEAGAGTFVELADVGAVTRQLIDHVNELARVEQSIEAEVSYSQTTWRGVRI